MSEFLQNDLQGSFQTGLGQVLHLFRDLNLIPQNEENLPQATRDTLARLRNLTSAERPAVHNEIENFTFVVPNETFL